MKRNYQIQELLKHHKQKNVIKVVESHGHTQGLIRFPWDMFIDAHEWSICRRECEELEN